MLRGGYMDDQTAAARGDAPGAHIEDSAPHQFAANLFGPFQISRDGTPITDGAGLSRTSARTLLKWFLLNRDLRVESRELSGLLWPDHTSSRNPNRLHVTLHYLRHVLEPDLGARQQSTFIRSDGRGRYWFDFAGCWRTDIAEVEQLFARGKAAENSGDTEQAIISYERLLEYYCRSFLPENLFDEAFDACRTEHEVAHRDAESRLLRLYLVQDAAHKALPIALSILDRDPFSEEASTAIAEICLQQGNVLAARTQFRRYLESVHRDLGAAPSRSALQMWERIERAG